MVWGKSIICDLSFKEVTSMFLILLGCKGYNGEKGMRHGNEGVKGIRHDCEGTKCKRMKGMGARHGYKDQKCKIWV